jgi:hypothetical protein
VLDDGAEGDVQLGGWGGRPTSGDPIRLLDQGGRESPIDGHLGRGLEVGGSDPPARSVAQDERPASLTGRLEMSASGAVGGGDLDHVHGRRLDGWRGAPVGENDVVMTDSGGSQPAQAAVTDPGGAEQEVRCQREAERECRRQAEVLKRHAQRVAAGGLTARAATAMRPNGPVSIRPESSPLAAYPPSGGDSGAEEVGQILAWPLHGDDGSVLGALSVGLPEPVGPSEFIGQILVALVEQTGLALGRALESERRRGVELELTERHRMVTELTALVPGRAAPHRRRWSMWW